MTDALLNGANTHMKGRPDGLKAAIRQFFPEASGAVGITYGMRSIMRSARIALYKSKKIADRARHCAFRGNGFDGIARGAPARRGHA